MILQCTPNLTPYCNWVSASSRWWVSRVSRPPSAVPPPKFRRCQCLSSACSKSGTWSLQLWRTRREKWRVFFNWVVVFHQPNWKICEPSNWIMSLGRGEKENVWNHHPVLFLKFKQKNLEVILVRSRSGILIPAVDSLWTSGLDTIPTLWW